MIARGSLHVIHEAHHDRIVERLGQRIGEKIAELEAAALGHAGEFGALARDLEHAGREIEPEDLVRRLGAPA